MAICKLLMSSLFRLHVLANTEDNSDTGDIELIRHLHVNVSSLKILLQGTTFAIIVIIIIIFIIVFFLNVWNQSIISISVENLFGFTTWKLFNPPISVHRNSYMYLFYFREHSSI